MSISPHTIISVCGFSLLISLSFATTTHNYYGFMVWASLVAQRLKRLPAMWKTQVQSLGREDSLEKEMATHSSILAWKIHGQKSLASYSP